MGVGVRNEAIWPTLMADKIQNKINKKVSLLITEHTAYQLRLQLKIFIKL